MLRLTHVFLIVLFIYVVPCYYVSNTFVTYPPPSPLTPNHMNDQTGNIERKFPSFELLSIFKIVVISIISTFFLFMVFLHLCTTARYVTFTTNLTILRKNKTVSTLTQAMMIPLLAPLTLLLFGFLLG